MSTKAYITPQLLRWARERYGLSTAEAAERLHVSLDLLQEWEGGEALPTLRQAQDVASRLNVPLGYLFLSTPPSEDLPIPDLRRVADEPRSAASPELIDLVSDVLLKQEWYRDYQEREEAEPLPFIGKYSLADKPTTVATDIRQSIGLDATLRQEAQSLDGFLRKLIGRVESAGVLVLRSGIVQNNTHRALNVAEFRGFAISDRVAPLVFINGRDAKSAQIFTLGHELAHLWIGSSGISNPGYLRLPSQHENTTELFCNQVAANLLVPAEDFLSRWSSVESLDS